MAANSGAFFVDFGLGELIATVADPLYRELGYWANFAIENVVPPPEAVIHAWSHSDMSWGQLSYMLAWSGVDIPDNPGVQQGFFPNNAAAWMKIIHATESPLPLEMLTQNLYLDRMSRKDFEADIHRHGFKNDQKITELLSPPYVFSPEDERVLHSLRSTIHIAGEAGPAAIDLQYKQRLAAGGVVDDQDRYFFEKIVQPPTYLEAIELAQRDLLVGQGKSFDADGNPPDDRGTAAEQRTEFNRLMILEKFTEPKIIDYLWALRQRLPTEGELIEAAVKNAFVGPLAKILGLDQEYHTQPQFIVGTDKLGLSGSPKISQADMTAHILNHKLVKGNEYEGKELEADETDDEAKARAEKYYNAQDPSLLTWAQVFWRSHWVNLSPEQIYECLQRQRVIDTTKAGGAAGLQDYKNAIAELDFPGNPNNTPETRYAIACFYALTTLPFAVTLPDGTVLEAGSAGKGLGRNPNVPPVTMDIVKIVLRSNDYAPLYRGNLADIAYKVLRLVDIRWIAQRSLRSQTFARSAIGYDEQIGKDLPDEDNGGAGGTGAGPTPLQKFVFAWCRENFLDRGQSDPSAQSLATLATSMAATSNKVQIRPLTRLYERAYRVGLIDAPRYAQLLKYAGQRVYESGGRAVPQKVPRGEGLIAGLEPGVVEDMGVYTGLNPSVPGIGLEPGVVGEMSLRDLLLQDTGVYTLQPLQDLTVEGKLASFADIADKDLDIFDISDMEADLYDDVGAAAYVDEQDSIDAAQDQLESEIDALTGP